MTIEIQAPYRLILAESPQQVMALQAYIQAAYTLEFNARIPHFLPCLLGLYRADGVLVGACGLNHASTGKREQPLYLEQYLEQLHIAVRFRERDRDAIRAVLARTAM